MYWAFYFSGITLTIFGITVINWFTRNTNVDFDNAIYPSIMFPVSADSIKDGTKYLFPLPMLSHVIPWMVST